MERDEQGREVRRRPPPGHREPELDDDAWPTLEHSPYTFEGRIEQLGTLSRGMRRRRLSGMRAVGMVVAIALLAPILLGAISIMARALSG